MVRVAASARWPLHCQALASHWLCTDKFHWRAIQQQLQRPHAVRFVHNNQMPRVHNNQLRLCDPTVSARLLRQGKSLMRWLQTGELRCQLLLQPDPHGHPCSSDSALGT